MKYLIVLMIFMAGCTKKTESRSCEFLNVKYGDIITPKEGFYRGVKMVADDVRDNVIHAYFKKDPTYKSWWHCRDVEKVK